MTTVFTKTVEEYFQWSLFGPLFISLDWSPERL